MEGMDNLTDSSSETLPMSPAASCSASASNEGDALLRLDAFLAEAIKRAEFAVELCTQIEPGGRSVEETRELDAALDRWLVRRGRAHHYAA
jgi:hypothetical protein